MGQRQWSICSSCSTGHALFERRRWQWFVGCHLFVQYYEVYMVIEDSRVCPRSHKRSPENLPSLNRSMGRCYDTVNLKFNNLTRHLQQWSALGTSRALAISMTVLNTITMHNTHAYNKKLLGNYSGNTGCPAVICYSTHVPCPGPFNSVFWSVQSHQWPFFSLIQLCVFLSRYVMFNFVALFVQLASK